MLWYEVGYGPDSSEYLFAIVSGGKRQGAEAVGS